MFVWKVVLRKLFVLVLCLLLPTIVQASSPGLLLTELLIDQHTENPEPSSFIEIYNPASTEVNLDGWQIQYRETAKEEAGDWSVVAQLDGEIGAEDFLIIAAGEYSEGADFEFTEDFAGFNLSGEIQLIMPESENFDESVQDELKWGESESGQAAIAPKAGESLKRFAEGAEFISTGDNSHDFFISNHPSPGSLDSHSGEEPEEYPALDITELLPDPVSPQTDAEHEFVEIYNPNQAAVNLTGYVIQTGSSFNYTQTLDNISIDPGEYKAFFSADTSLTLANGGGSARLLNPDGEIISQAESYPKAVPGSSWALIDDVWRWTEKPTPNQANELVVAEDDETDSQTESNLKPCREDQFRNPETNRCKLKQTSSSQLKPCAANQERNPETNRCRLISSASTTLKPCLPNQVRNPETNRCKKIDDGTDLKPCADNQERNPETNRCRLVSTNTDASSLSEEEEDAVLAATDSMKNLPLVGVIGGGALMYALYEFRYDLRNSFQKARGYLGFRKSSGRDP